MTEGQGRHDGCSVAMRYLLLIRGLGGRRTTIPDLGLGAHPQRVGLGEAARILERPAPGAEHEGPAQRRCDLRFDARRGASIPYDGAWSYQPAGVAQLAPLLV